MTAQAISADNPRPGFYKLRYDRNGAWKPVAIWKDANGMLVCRVADKMESAAQVWTWCADKPVPKDAAKFAFEHGYWPDEPAPIALSNLPADPFEALKIEIEAQRARAEEWLGKRPTIMTQADCDLAVNFERELLRLNKRADSLHKTEKAPHLEACQATDDKYRFRKAVADVAAKLRLVFGRFMATEEVRKKAAAAAAYEAEKARIEAEAKKLLADDPIAALTSPPPELPLGPEPVKVQAGGGIGRKAGLRDVWVGTVTDYREAAMYFVEHPKLKEVVDSLVQHQARDLKDSAKIPGVTITKERRAA